MLAGHLLPILTGNGFCDRTGSEVIKAGRAASMIGGIKFCRHLKISNPAARRPAKLIFDSCTELIGYGK